MKQYPLFVTDVRYWQDFDLWIANPVVDLSRGELPSTLVVKIRDYVPVKDFVCGSEPVFMYRQGGRK